MNNLQGKIAWITGAGSGIGEATAKALACKGASVVLTGRRVEPLERVAEEIRKTGGQADVLSGDVTDKRRVQEIADSIVTKRGRIDILVNNAGMNVSGRSWRDLSPDCAQEVIAGNLSSAFYVVTSVLPAMRAQRDGLLIHISSWAGRYISRGRAQLYGGKARRGCHEPQS
jgi:NADP-dependent 3-hydroxy acid dehydrogenase YdfG